MCCSVFWIKAAVLTHINPQWCERRLHSLVAGVLLHVFSKHQRHPETCLHVRAPFGRGNVAPEAGEQQHFQFLRRYSDAKGCGFMCLFMTTSWVQQEEGWRGGGRRVPLWLYHSINKGRTHSRAAHSSSSRQPAAGSRPCARDNARCSEL